METDFDVRFTENPPFLDKAVKERTAEEPGNSDIPARPRAPCLSLQYFAHKTKMARNCEKKLIGLNRLWLEKQQKGSTLDIFDIMLSCRRF